MNHTKSKQKLEQNEGLESMQYSDHGAGPLATHSLLTDEGHR
jgi:hypothetical protein